MKNGTSGNFVVRSGLLVVHLLPREDETLLGGRDSLLLLHSLFDSLHTVGGLDVDLYFLSSQSLDLYEHSVIRG